MSNASEISPGSSSPARIQGFCYQRPEDGRGRAKKIVHLARAGVLDLHVQIVDKGGANNLHMHTNCDEAFLVLDGRVRFYGENDAVIAECGALEGVVIPAEAPYRFESVGDAPLQIMRIGGTHLGKKEKRVNLGEAPEWMRRESRALVDESKWDR